MQFYSFSIVEGIRNKQKKKERNRKHSKNVVQRDGCVKDDKNSKINLNNFGVSRIARCVRLEKATVH